LIYIYIFNFNLHKILTEYLFQANVQAVPNLFESQSSFSVADLYLDKDKLKGWSISQHQSLTGFEKIRVVGKGAFGTAVLYRKKDDDSVVILKEINILDLKTRERQLAVNEVSYFVCSMSVLVYKFKK
jgi:hypothetical protein